jgi:membrane protein YqaA with SNARE-associated domain
MHPAIRHFFELLLNLDAPGLLILGTLDSSFLFLPIGNDLLLVALTIRKQSGLPLYVACAALGSVIGVLLVDLVARKGGEIGLQKMLSKRRYEYLKRRISERAGPAIALSALAPPPFPFTPMIAAASVFNYSRVRLITVVFVARVVRFSIVGLLAIRFGPQILAIAKSNAFLALMAGIIVVSVIGSVISVRQWIRQSRRG